MRNLGDQFQKLGELVPSMPAELLTADARAVVVPDASMTTDARRAMCEELMAVGFAQVTMLDKACQPSGNVETGPSVVAA